MRHTREMEDMHKKVSKLVERHKKDIGHMMEEEEKEIEEDEE